MGKPVNKPIVLKAYLVERKTGKIVLSNTWRNRIPMLLIVKLSAWIYALMDNYPPENYKLMVYINGVEDERTEWLRNKFSELNITIIEEPLKQVAK